MAFTDQIKTSFESKVFNDEPGSFIYINRTYASKNEPQPDSEDLKLIKLFDSPDESQLTGNHAFSGPYGHEKCNLDIYEKIYFYRPLFDSSEHEKRTQEIAKETGANKFFKEWNAKDKKINRSITTDEENWIERRDEQRELAREELEKKYESELQEYYKILDPYNKSLKGSFLINDELRTPITAKNLDKYITPNKTSLTLISESLIAEWYSLDDSFALKADTPQKKITAIKKRRADIIKFLPEGKNIDELLDQELLENHKVTRKTINDKKIKKAQEEAQEDKEHRIATGEATFTEVVNQLLITPQFYLLLIGAGLFFYFFYQLENWEPKETINCGNPQSSYEENVCDRAYERTYEEKWGRKPGKLPKIP